MGVSSSRSCGEGIGIFDAAPPPLTQEEVAVVQAIAHSSKIVGLTEQKLQDAGDKSDANGPYRNRDNRIARYLVVECLKCFSDVLKERECMEHEITPAHAHEAFAMLSQECSEVSLRQLQADLHESKLVMDRTIGSMVYEIETLCFHLPQELLRDHVTFWLPDGESLLDDDSAGKLLDSGPLKQQLEKTVFEHFDSDKMGELTIDQTVQCLVAFQKIPSTYTTWTNSYLRKFLDKHFFTTRGEMSRFNFRKMFSAVADGIIWGMYALNEIGIEPMMLINLFTKYLSGRSLAYLVRAFEILNAHNSDQIIGQQAVEVVAMAANPRDGRSARRTQRVLTQGDSKGTWRMRLDVNGDMQITLAEWVLFWGRNCQGRPPKLRETLAMYRIFDYMRLLQYRRKGVLSDRYVLLFDAMDTDASGNVSIEELVNVMNRLPAATTGSGPPSKSARERTEVDRLASLQLQAMDEDEDGQISLAEWLTWAEGRGDLDQMVALNFHNFERKFGAPFGV